MEQPSRIKRSYTVPILLVLLTLSLIGNVFYFSLYLQNNQQKRIDKGMAILNSLSETGTSLGKLSVLLPVLDKETGSKREQSLYELGAAFIGQTGSIVTLMDKAYEYSFRPSDWPEDYLGIAAEFTKSVEKTALEGSSSDRERLAELAAGLGERLEAIDITVQSRNRALTIQADKDWPDVCLQMLKAMESYLKG